MSAAGGEWAAEDDQLQEMERGDKAAAGEVFSLDELQGGDKKEAKAKKNIFGTNKKHESVLEGMVGGIASAGVNLIDKTAGKVVRVGAQAYLDNVEPEWIKKKRVAAKEDMAYCQCRILRKVRKVFRGWFKKHDFYYRNPDNMSFIKNTPTFHCFWMLTLSIALGTHGVLQPDWAKFQSSRYGFLSPRSKSRLMFGILGCCQHVDEVSPTDFDPPNTTCTDYKDQDVGLCRFVSEHRVPVFARGQEQVTWDNCGKLTGDNNGFDRQECLQMEWICSAKHTHMQILLYIVLVSTTLALLASFGATTEAACCRSKESLMKKGDDTAWLQFRKRVVIKYVMVAKATAAIGSLASLCCSVLWNGFTEKLAAVYREQGGVDRRMGCSGTGECFKYGWGYWTTVMAACALPFSTILLQSIFLRFERRTTEQFRLELGRQKAQEYLKKTSHIRREAAQKIGAAMEAVEAIRKLGEFGSSLLNHLQLDNFDDEELERAFDEVDEDGSGEIDHDEVRIFLHKVMKRDPPKEALKEFINRFDDDGDGVIDFDEFTSGITKMRQERAELTVRERKAHKLVKSLKFASRRDTMLKSLQVSTFKFEDLRRAFDAIDDDESGTIDRDEVPHLLAELLQAPPPRSAVKAFLIEFDNDGDGAITWEEFLAGMTKLKEETEKALLKAQGVVVQKVVAVKKAPKPRAAPKSKKEQSPRGELIAEVYVAQDPLGSLPEEIALRLDPEQLVVLPKGGTSALLKWRWAMITDLALEKSVDDDVMDLVTMTWSDSKYSFEMNDATPAVTSMLAIRRARLAATELPGWKDPGPTTVHPLDCHECLPPDADLPEDLVLWLGPKGLEFFDPDAATDVLLLFGWDQVMSFAEGEDKDEDDALGVLHVRSLLWHGRHILRVPAAYPTSPSFSFASARAGCHQGAR